MKSVLENRGTRKKNGAGAMRVGGDRILMNVTLARITRPGRSAEQGKISIEWSNEWSNEWSRARFVPFLFFSTDEQVQTGKPSVQPPFSFSLPLKQHWLVTGDLADCAAHTRLLWHFFCLPCYFTFCFLKQARYLALDHGRRQSSSARLFKVDKLTALPQV